MIKDIRINTDKLVQGMVMWYNRKPILLRFFKSLVKAIQTLFNGWIPFRNLKTQETYIFSQKIALEKYVNDRLGVIGEIIISDASTNAVFFPLDYTDGEPVYIGLDTDSLYVSLDGTDSIDAVAQDFAVKIPTAFTNEQELLVSSIISRFKLAGMTFKVIRI